MCQLKKKISFLPVLWGLAKPLLEKWLKSEYEEKGEYHIEADIPGFKKDEISVECEDGYVIINAIKNSEEKEDSDKNYIKRERFYGKVTRKFYVGDVDSDKVKAKFKDGILEIVVPKQEKLPNKKNIEMQCVLLFVDGLNPDFKEVRSIILNHSPLPSVLEVYAEIKREESSHKVMTPTPETLVLP